jgi:hypothetical protein
VTMNCLDCSIEVECVVITRVELYGPKFAVLT